MWNSCLKKSQCTYSVLYTCVSCLISPLLTQYWHCMHDVISWILSTVGECNFSSIVFKRIVCWCSDICDISFENTCLLMSKDEIFHVRWKEARFIWMLSYTRFIKQNKLYVTWLLKVSSKQMIKGISSITDFVMIFVLLMQQ